MAHSRSAPDSVLPGPGSRTVLVTGAGGLLGRAVCRVFAGAGQRVIGLTRTSAVDPVCAETVNFSLEDSAQISAAVAAAAPDWIVHAAANTDVDACEREPAAAARLHGEASANLASAAARRDARLLYVSTDSVYDGDRPGAHAESSRVRPINAYAHTKLAGEHACLAVAPGTIVARVNFFSLEPPAPRGLAHWMLSNLRAGRPFNGFTDVNFSPLSTHDLALTLLAMLTRNLPGGIYNTGASDACSKYVFAQQLAALVGADAGLIRAAGLISGPLAAPRPRNTAMDSRRLATALGCVLPTVEESLRAAVAEAGLHAVAVGCAS
jgi:dTDP-4-dehydrorhamnose reductase